MSFVTKFQAESMSPVLFTMNKDLLKLIPKIASHPFYSDDANWFRVSFVFKHTQSRKRFVPSFLNFSATKRLKVRSGMNGGDEYTLKKIILSKSDRSHFVIFESEIPDVANFNFALLGEGVQPDITSPIMTSITGPAAGEYSAGDALNFYLNFDEPVFVTGQPKLYLDIDFVYKEAGYISGSGSSSLLFRYIVGSSDNDSEGIQIDSFNLNGGTIKDASDNNASINVGSQSLNLITIQNDLTAPVISNITSSSPALLVTGDTLNVSVNFSEAVLITGFPTLTLDLGGVSKIAEYSHTDGSSVIFNYTIGPADAAQYNLLVNEINLNGGTIQDASGNNAGIIFSPVTINSQVNPDVVAPALEDIIVLNSSESPFFTNDVVQFVAEFSESVNYTGSPRLVLSINSQTKYANIVSSSGSNLLFEYTIAAGDIGDIIIYSVDLNGGTIKDDVENNATLSFNGVYASLSINPDIVGPSVVSVTGEEGDYVTGDSVQFTVQFSENIQVTDPGNVSLSLSLDSGVVSAPLTAISGSTATFSYTVTSNDQETTSLTISSINLGGLATIKDSANNSANLSLANASQFNSAANGIVLTFTANPVVLSTIPLGLRSLFNGNVYCTAVQSDGKILVGGIFTACNGAVANKIVRLNSDGSTDTSFVTGIGFGTATTEWVNTIVVQSNGKILVGGKFTTYNGTSSANIARLSSTGTIDSSALFNVGSGFNDEVFAIAVQSDAKIVVGGNFGTYKGTTAPKIARLSSTGAMDSAALFNVGTVGFDGTVYAIAINTSGGSIYVGGNFSNYKGVAAARIIRLTSAGNADSGFAIGTGFNNAVRSIAVKSSGNIVVGGLFSTYKGTNAGKIVEISGGGTQLSAFNITTGFDGLVYTVAVQSDNKVLVGGTFTTYKGSACFDNICRLNTDGSLDTTFVAGTSITGAGLNGYVRSISIASSQNIVVGGEFTSYKNNGAIVYPKNYIISLNSIATENSSILTTKTGFTGSNINEIISQSDGKLVITGLLGQYNGSSTTSTIIRLNSDGSEDTSFTKSLISSITAVAAQSDGKFIIGGTFTSVNGTTANRIARLNSDGSLDTSFVTGTGFASGSSISSIKIQSDGKVLVAGFFTSYNGSSRSCIVRLNSDGSVDTNFSIGTGFDSTITGMVIHDNKIIVGGYFTIYNGTTANRIARLNSDGSLDTSFVTGTGFNGTVFEVAVQSDGAILVGGGSFTAYNGIGATKKMVRLNSDGSLDTNFMTEAGFGSTTSISYIKTQSNGKILVGGTFTSVNGTTQNNIVRLNSDGSLDTSFVTGTGFNGTVNTILVESNGSIVVGGSFSTYKIANFDKIARLNSDGSYSTF